MKKGKTNKFLILIGLSILFVLLLSACSKDDKDKDTTKPDANNEEKPNEEVVKNDNEPQKGGTIRVGVSEEPDTLDIQRTGMSMASNIISQMAGTLLTRDPETNEIKPYLAESYEISEDGLTITFKLKSGVTFHDGTPLNAEAWKYSFNRALNPDTGSVLSGSLLSSVKEVSAPDETTLILELNQPSAPLLLSLADSSYLSPLSKEAVESFGDEYGRNPVSVGPWKYSEWKTGQSITLERNDDFKWAQPYFKNKESVYPDKLEFKFIKDYQTRMAALDSGSIDVTYGVEPRDIKKYQDSKDFYVMEVDREGIGQFLELNTENEKLKDLRVRQALNMAIDKEILIQASLDGNGSVAHGPLSPNLFGYDPEVENYGYKYDQAEAIKLLESAGYAKNSKGVMEKDGQELTFELITSADGNQDAQIIQAMLKEIGVEIKILTMEIATVVEKASLGEYELTFLSYSYSDPDVLFLLFHSSQINGLNISRTNNAELDELLEKAREEMVPEKRQEIYAKAQKIIVEEAYWVPIYIDKIFNVFSNKVPNAERVTSGVMYQDSWVVQ